MFLDTCYYMVPFNCDKNMCQDFAGFGRLWVVLDGCGWLWLVAGGIGWFWLVACFITNHLFAWKLNCKLKQSNLSVLLITHDSAGSTLVIWCIGTFFRPHLMKKEEYCLLIFYHFKWKCFSNPRAVDCVLPCHSHTQHIWAYDPASLHQEIQPVMHSLDEKHKCQGFEH